MSKKVTIVIIVSALIIILGIASYFYWNHQEKESPNYTAEDITDNALKGVLPSFGTNPLENKPDVNPADKANPFKDIRTNPFE